MFLGCQVYVEYVARTLQHVQEHFRRKMLDFPLIHSRMPKPCPYRPRRPGQCLPMHFKVALPRLQSKIYTDFPRNHSIPFRLHGNQRISYTVVRVSLKSQSITCVTN